MAPWDNDGIVEAAPTGSPAASDAPWDSDAVVASPKAAPKAVKDDAPWADDKPVPADHPVARALRKLQSDKSVPAPIQAGIGSPSVDQIYFNNSNESQALPAGAAGYPDLLGNDMLDIRKSGGFVTPQYIVDHGKQHGFNIDPEQAKTAAAHFNKYGSLPTIATPHYELPTVPETSPDDEAGDQADVVSRGYGDGGSLGLSPKIIALINSYSSGQPYSYELARIRQLDQQDEENHPVTRFASELAGGASLPMGEMKTLPQAIGKSAAFGAAYNAISSDAPDIGTRLLQTIEGGAAGGALGAVLHTGTASVPWIKNRVWGPKDGPVHAFDSDGNHVGSFRSLDEAQTKAPDSLYVQKDGIVGNDLKAPEAATAPETPASKAVEEEVVSEGSEPTRYTDPRYTPDDKTVGRLHRDYEEIRQALYPDTPKLTREEFEKGWKGAVNSPMDIPEGAGFHYDREISDGNEAVFNIRDFDDSPIGYAIVDKKTGEIFASDQRLSDGPNSMGHPRRLAPEDEAALLQSLRETGVKDLPDPSVSKAPEPKTAAGGEGGEPPRDNEPPKGPPGDEPPSGDGGVPPPEDPDHPINRLLKAIDEAKSARNQTDSMRRAEMKERVGKAAETGQFVSGQAGFHAELSELSGKHKTAEFNPLDHLDQSDIDGLFDTIKNHPTFSFFDGIQARSGLEKLLGARDGLPTRSELHLLEQVFPKDMISGLSSKDDLISRIKDSVINSLNVPRALMASMDLSAPGRQGIFLVGTKAYWKAFVPMVKAFGSSKVYEAISNEIASRPSYKYMQRSGLALTNVGKELSTREEQFIGQYAEKIPLVGPLVKASDRAYSGFLNKLRADTFDSILKDTRDLGIDVNRNPKAIRDIAKFVNAATGRGDLGSFNQAATALSTAFFSPRLIASRLQLLSMPLRPSTYLTLNPAVRKAYFTNLFKFSGLALTTMGLAKAAGADVEADPRSSDFGKIKIGNTRFDVLGGFQQYIRAGAQMISGQRKGADGSVSNLGEGYKADTRFTVLENLIFNKLAPVPSFVKDILSGKDAVGQKLDYDIGHLQQNPIWSRLVPLVFQDINDAYQDAGFGRAALVAPAAVFGIGTQTYQTKGKNRGLKEGGKDDPLGDPNDPISKEVSRLSGDSKKGLVTPPSPSIFIDGKQTRLSDDDYKKYERLAAEYIKNDLRQTMASPDWKGMSDEDRRDTVKQIVKDQRANARDAIRDTLGQTPPKEESGGIIPKAHAGDLPPWEQDRAFSIYDFKAGIPTSGHRTPEGNAAVGGVPNSDHLSGDGVDYVPAHGQSITQLAREAKAFFGPSAWIHPEPRKNHVHVSMYGLHAPYIGQKGIK